MSLTYDKTSKKPTIFNRLFGVSVEQFNEILVKIKPLWEKEIIGSYKRPGRDYKLAISDMLLMVLLYYRSYITQAFIGYLFGIDVSRVCRIIKQLEPLVASVMAIQKTKHLSKEEVETLLIDATEQPIERPKKNQKSYYSGKKKRHTLKTEIRVTQKGRIVHVSHSKPGAVHDFALHKEEPPLPTESRAYVDSGYQGLDKLHKATELPYKSSKNNSLDQEKKDYNQALSKCRVVVENIIGDIKTFRILSDRYRNKCKRYNVKFNIIAGIVNMKNGFVAS